MQYHKIGGVGAAGRGQCTAFEKLDGSNVSWSWRRGLGFAGPSTRRGPFDRTHEGLSQAFDAWERIRESVDRALARGTDAEHAVAFFEFLGPGSFAGLHVEADPKRLVLIDVAVPLKKGQDDLAFMGPEEFVRAFQDHVEIPPVVFRGRFSDRLVQDVRSGRLAVTEGVVVKGGRTGKVWMCKIKTDAWEERLRRTFAQGKWKAHDMVERGVEDDA